MAWVLRLLSVLAAAITSLFVARDAFNFGIIEILVTVTLVVGVAVIAVGWTVRREI
jgi:Mg2+/citrate symporter